MATNQEKTIDIRFPYFGIDVSQAFGAQRPSTSPMAINVRAYDSGTGRLRGGSRAGITPFLGKGSTVQVNGFSLIQSLSVIVTADQNATPQPDFTLSPASAYLSGLQFTTITGVGFTGATSVMFGSVPAQWFFVVNDTTITCSMFPVASAQTVTVTVTKADATTLTAPFAFNFAPITGTFTLHSESASAVNLVTGCLGPDQQVWAVSNPDPLARITSGGTLTYPALSGTAFTIAQVAGPDGNVWSVDIISLSGSTAKNIWRSVPGGGSTKFVLETSSTNRYWSIIPGPKGDGNLYVFASANSDADGYIYRVTPAGVVTRSTIYTGKNLLGAVIGPDQQAWGIGSDEVIRSVDLTTWPPTMTDHARTGVPFNTFTVIIGNDLRVWTFNNAMSVYAFSVTNPTGGSYYSSSFGSLTNFGQGCAGPDGKMWQIDESNPAAANLISSAADGSQALIGPFNLSFGDVFNYAILIAGDDGALYCAGQGATTGTFVKFLG